MRKTLLVVALLITVTFLVACHSEQRPPIPTENDGDQVEEMDTADPDEAASEADSEFMHETEHESEFLDGDAETEAAPESETETEIEPEGYVAPETDVDPDEIPRAERLPFSGTLVFPCTDEQLPTPAHAIWGDGVGSVYLGGKHLWRYDEIADTLTCDPESFEAILALDGRRVDGQTEIWVLALDRLGRYRGGSWNSFPLPADARLIADCRYVDTFEPERRYYCGWASLKLNGNDVVITLTTGHTGEDCNGSCMDGTVLYGFTAPDGGWKTSTGCPNLVPGEETQGYWLEDHYYILGGNTLYSLTNDTLACQVVTTFTPDSPHNRLRLYGADDGGLWIGEYLPGGLGNASFRQLYSAFIFNPISVSRTPLALPREPNWMSVSSNGLARFPPLFRSYSLSEIESGFMGRKCRITTALFAKAADFSRMDLTSEEYVVLNGASCLAPDNFYEELAFHSLMQAQHWRDDKTAWLPDLMMRITFSK